MLKWIVVCAALVACDPEDSPQDSVLDGGAQTDGGGQGDQDGSTFSTTPDAATVQCADEITFDETFDIAPGVGETQIHGDAAFTGSGVWFTFNREEEDGSKFDVWATYIGCDGAAIVAPFRVNELLGFNDVDPVIEVLDDRVVVAWSRDTPDVEFNLSLAYRVFDLDGVAQAGDQTLVTELDGEPLVANHWLPAITAWPGGFAIAGSRGGIEDMMGFQAFVQRLDSNGVPTGPTVARVGQFGQVEPEVAADEAGNLYVAWTEQRDTDTVVHTQLSAGADAFDPVPEVPFSGVSSTVGVAASDGRWIAASLDPGGGLKAALIRGGQFGDETQPVLFGTPGSQDHSPTLATDTSGGWIGWYRIISGIRNAVWLSRFASVDGAAAAVGEPQMIPTDGPAAPYALVVVDVGPGVLVAWHEGMNPNFTLRARFIRD